MVTQILPTVIFLYGPPAVGKFTIGSHLSELTGIGLVHNHMTVDIAIAVFGLDKEARHDLLVQLRYDIAIGAIKKGYSLITTLSYSGLIDDGWLADMYNGVKAAGGAMKFVQLTAPKEVLMERVAASSHRDSMGKIVTTDDLADCFLRRDVEATVPYSSFMVDTTQQTPLESAELIAKHIAYPSAPADA